MGGIWWRCIQVGAGWVAYTVFWCTGVIWALCLEMPVHCIRSLVAVVRGRETVRGARAAFQVLQPRKWTRLATTREVGMPGPPAPGLVLQAFLVRRLWWWGAKRIGLLMDPHPFTCSGPADAQLTFASRIPPYTAAAHRNSSPPLLSSQADKATRLWLAFPLAPCPAPLSPSASMDINQVLEGTLSPGACPQRTRASRPN